MALTFDQDRKSRLLVLPAWFDEANKLRRQTVEIMRGLDLAGIDCALPDLPGCNESQALLAEQTLEGWSTAAAAAAVWFRATHVLTLRAGALISPSGLPGWSYAPIGGPRVLRNLLRARAIAASEAGQRERPEDLLAAARRDGLEVAGWRLGGALFRALETVEPSSQLVAIEQQSLVGPPLWLRAEPDDDSQQAAELAAIIAGGINGQ